MLDNTFIQDKVKTLQTVRQWAESELTILGIPTVVVQTVSIPPDPEIAVLRNSNSWLNLTIQDIAKILELPQEGTMKDLPAHAVKIMRELTDFRKK